MASTLPDSFSDTVKRVRRYSKATLLGIKEQVSQKTAPFLAQIMPWHADKKKAKGTFTEARLGRGSAAGPCGGRGCAPGEGFVTINTVEFGAFKKASHANPVDIAVRGMCHAYDDTLEKSASPLKPFPLPFMHLSYMPIREIGSITGDAVVLQHIKENPRRRVIYGSDIAVSRLMTSPHAVNSFDVQVETNGIYIVISESAAGGRTPFDNCMDYEWVNETATINVPPEGCWRQINASVPLARENARATRVFRAQAKQRAVVGWPSGEKSQYQSTTILRYRKWTLNPGTDEEIDVVIRCQIDAATKSSSGTPPQYMRLFSMLEGPPHRGAVSWKNQTIAAGALLTKATADNSCKAAHWAALALLAGVDVIKIALVQRTHVASSDDHEVVAVATRTTRDFASQMGVTQNHLFTVLKGIANGILQTHLQTNRVATFFVMKETTQDRESKKCRLLVMRPETSSPTHNDGDADDAGHSQDATSVEAAFVGTAAAVDRSTASDGLKGDDLPTDILPAGILPADIGATLKTTDLGATKEFATRSKSGFSTAVTTPETVKTVSPVPPLGGSNVDFDAFIYFSPKECRRDDDAIAVHADGTVSIAIFVPLATPTIIEYARDGHIDHVYWGISDIKCKFDGNCTVPHRCTFRHASRANMEIKILKKITDLKPTERSGFVEGESNEAVVITLDPNCPDSAPIRTSVRRVQVKYWHAETLPPLHAEAAERMNNGLSGLYTGDVKRFDEYTLDERGKRVRMERWYTLLRFYVETCMDRFNDCAQKICLGAGVPVTLMGQRYSYPPARRVIKNEEMADEKVTAVIVTKKDPNTVCCFSHPLRDYECMYNIHTLRMVLTGSTHPHPILTQAYMDARNEVLRYVNKMCYANL
jgi:hypothetical protein